MKSLSSRRSREVGVGAVGSPRPVSPSPTFSTTHAHDAAGSSSPTGGRANPMTLHGNWARAIEIVHAAEVIGQLLHDLDLLRADTLVTHRPWRRDRRGDRCRRGSRGTLLHHYRADRGAR